ncbi:MULTISPECIES: anthranilate synthase component I family protein [Streptomyces]|uniref:anthranilate synthase component I family protein n=1 Tax=Streptomyces TaxID=1883 RepID=UPI001E50D72F|nr:MULTISPECIES: anthranilate synthase component I family protein [Streptomyces]UFQ19062.1 anthranilate synthase component I family protein [Streptomyces huasconensis]WCL88681.1 anthranilate synthase component I family protein [Streptomyces sp. JCM 35825]
MATAVESLAAVRSGLRAGDVVYRYELRGPEVDPVVAAAALRGSDRIMLSREAAEPEPAVLLAVGELAVAQRTGPARDRSAPTLVTSAIDFLTGLEFAADAAPDERSWYGCIAYDAVTDFERLSLRPTNMPTYDIFLPEVLIRFDRTGSTVVGRGATVSQARDAAERAERILRAARERAASPARVGVGAFGHGPDEYLEAVRRAKEYILAGDIFQVVLSLRYSAPGEVDGLRVYRQLMEFNRSPYHFWYHSGEFEVVGASPEPCVTLAGSDVLIRPLAGTRPRGADPVADRAAEQDLLSSEKELAEHRMLVDLARNDLGRVCVPNSVHVPRLMEIERYSHVMHLTSDVRGQFRPGCRTDDLLRAGFPAGTMTGAPKLRAIEIIDELEPVGRGLYSGAVGSFGAGHADLYLTIRSLVMHQGELHLQAGGGIVYDSDPLAEREECVAKLRAAARAAGVRLGPEVPA